MNIDNIVSLTVLLQEIGLDSNIGKKLLQKICFRPAAFELRERILIEKDLLTCSFLFQRVKQEYVCSYYDASLLKSIDYPEQNIQSIDIRELDNRM